MRCSRAVAAFAFCIATAAHGEELKVISAAILYETGQAAPSVGFHSVAEDGAVWRAGIDGWTFTVDRERPVERGRRIVFGITATPYGAHGSRRMYRDGARDRTLEFDDVSFAAHAGMRFRQGERASLEPALVIGKEWIRGDAAAALRDAWRSPFAGVAVVQRVRFVTADDPLLARIEGVEIAATAEGYRGTRTWARAAITERAGVALGRVHLQQTLAAFDGRGLDRVSAFLAGGSWDALGPFAVFGQRYAEFRVSRGIIANGEADVALGRSLEVGIRGSIFRGDGERASGAMLLLTRQVSGVRIAAGVARSQSRTTLTATVGGALFPR